MNEETNDKTNREIESVESSATETLPAKKRNAAKKATKSAKKAGQQKGKKVSGKKREKASPRPFPAESIEQSLRVPTVIRELNGGNPWPPAEVANALTIGPKSPAFWYLTASARDYGFTAGTSSSAQVALDQLGRDYLYADSAEEEREAIKNAFFKIDVFRSVYEYYKGGSLPDLKYLQNTLESKFHIPPKYHQDFVRIFSDNCKFLERYGDIAAVALNGQEPQSHHSVVIGEPKSKTALVAFVIMPFTEKTDRHPRGFFEEVLKNLITPAAVDAGFKVETAKKEGSDMIHSTIVNDLLAADLVIADLTEHNPNVLFELGLRMATEKPTALIRAKGTLQIFDVDNLLRVVDYDPNLWPSTIQTDVPKLTSHIKGTWDNRESTRTYMQILKSQE